MAKAPAVLNVSPDLALPLDAVTQTFALLAVRRAGKSNAAAVMAEEMFAAGQPLLVIDPKGDWWGLRSNAAGDGPGLPIPIFGGLHGDMPLIPESGRMMAELVVEHNLTCILDVSRFSKAARIRFLTAFAERLYELHQADPQPRHIFLEEADRVLPQRVMQDMAACVGAFSDLIRLGGAFGLGVTLISQRSAVINKDGLTQVETMIPLRTTSPQDRKAIRDWMEHHAISTEIVDSLPSLLSGEAWVSSSFWLAEHGLPAIQKIRFRQRWTFDSGATPQVGQQRRVATLADIDIGALGDRMAAVVEKAAQDDPRALRSLIAGLERQMRGVATVGDECTRLTAENRDLRSQLAAALDRPAERVEVPVFGPGQVDSVWQAIDILRETTGSLQSALSVAANRAEAAATAPVQLGGALMGPPVGQATQPAPPPAADTPPAEPPCLPKAQRALLVVLAQFPDGRTKAQLSLLSGYSVKSSSFSNALGGLRSTGLINRGDLIQITPEGTAAVGNNWEPLPVGEQLVDHWMRQLGRAERTILTYLLAAFPAARSKEDISAATGYSVTSSSFSNALGKLRSLELVNRGQDIMADETFAREVGRG